VPIHPTSVAGALLQVAAHAVSEVRFCVTSVFVSNVAINASAMRLAT
jgi:hypothetical protein